MDFRILGPLEVAQDGQSLRLGGAQQRALLAVLVIYRGEVLSTDRLIEELWAGRPPVTAAKTVQGYVSQLRRVLGEAVIVTRGHGYRLAVSSDEVDVARFASLVSEGQTALADGDAVNAQQRLQEALALWRGEPLADFAYDSFAQAEIARLQESRLAALEARIDAELALGEDSGLVAELEALVHQHPLRERLTAQLMLALYRSGRQAEALECYRAARSRLLEELGLDPGRDLQELEAAILAHDRRLDSPRRGSARGPPPMARRRGGLVIAAAGVVLLAAVAAAAVTLSSSGSASLRVPANSLAVIDPRSNTVVASTSVGIGPGAITFGSGSLWVANTDDHTVSRIDPATLRATADRAVDGVPTGIAASGNAIWVVESDPGASAVTVQRVDPEFDEVGRAVRIATVVPGDSAAVAAQGNSVWIAPASGLLTRLDPATEEIAHQVDPNAGPAGIALGANALWVTDSEADNVTRIDPTGLQSPVPVGNGPTGIAVGYGGVWVADSLDDSVAWIDPATESVRTTIPVGRSPAGVAIGAGSVWVADSGDGTITRIDPRTGKVTARITVGGSPQAITVADGRVWVTVAAQIVKPIDLRSGDGTLRMETQLDPGSMDPALAGLPPSWQLFYAMCAKLVNYPDKPGAAGSRLIPEVARSLPARSADDRTYTFTIRPGFRFSPPSNQAVTARTFKYTIERSLSPKLGPNGLAHQPSDIVGEAAYAAGKASHISGVIARGDTLVIHLLAPAPDFPAQLALPPFCAVPTNTPIDPSGVRTLPSAGPYYLASYTPKQGAILERNPDYRGSRPHRFARIELTVGTRYQRAISDVEAGTADYTSFVGPVPASVRALAPELAARYGSGSRAAAAGDQQYYVNPQLELDYFYLNTHRPLFADVRLRRAVSYAVDRRALAQLGDPFDLLPDRPADHYLPPGIPGYSDAHVYPLGPDPAKARTLAQGAGRTAVLYTCDFYPCAQQAQILKTDLEAIGLHLRINTFPFFRMMARIARPGEPFDIVWSGWGLDHPDPANVLPPILEDPTLYPTFDDPIYQRRLADAGRLTGPARYLAYSNLDLDLARDAAPLIAYGNSSIADFFSARVGCQTYGVYGIDLAALCTKHS